MINALILSDLHLTEKAEDWYKWEVFGWARQIIAERNVKELYILGDIFDKKDRHPAELVNRLVKELCDCARLAPITALMGNHDYIKDKHPFLGFIHHLENVTFITKPTLLTHTGSKCLWLPHTRTPEEDWKDLDLTSPDYLFIHQSVIGSVVSNYFEMKEGLDPNIFEGTRARIYAGDIHVPQVVRKGKVLVEYIGTQYPVAFGDAYVPRAVLLDGDKSESLHMDTIRKANPKIRDVKELKHLIKTGSLSKGDQVKVTVMLSAEELSDWVEVREEVKAVCNREGIEIHDLKMEKIETDLETRLQGKSPHSVFSDMNPSKVLQRFAEHEKLGKDYVETGLQIIQGQ